MLETDVLDDEKELVHLAAEYGTPLFVYSGQSLQARAQGLLEIAASSGAVVRYAVKANNHPEIIRAFDRLGLDFDASSSYEAEELLRLGVDGKRISLSSQQPAYDLRALLKSGVHYTATSLHQLELFLQTEDRPESVGLRVNPGVGSGHNNRTTTGGVNSSFGLWHEYVPQALALAGAQGARIHRLHVHIGSGADIETWGSAMDAALGIVEIMPDVVTLDIGGGYKIHRYGQEKETNMASVMSIFVDRLEHFTQRTGRAISLEVEPGTWLVGHAGVLLTRVVDKVDTGKNGRVFLRVDTGMNDIARPGMYGSQHEITVVNRADDVKLSEYVVVGHNCETGDILTPAAGDPEGIEPRMLPNVSIGGILAIKDVGAYCRTMSHKGYNSYPNAFEVYVPVD